MHRDHRRSAGTDLARPRRDSARWLAEAGAARTVAELMATCRAYLASLEHPEIERLPASCRGVTLDGPEDLSALALDLVRHQCDDPSSDLMRVVEFFALANVRMARILRSARDREESGNVLGWLRAPGEPPRPVSPG